MYFKTTKIHNPLIKIASAFVFVCLFFILIFNSALGAFNPEINYQGKLTTPTGLAVADGNYNMVFRLYTVASGGSAVWTETRSAGDAVAVSNGLFSVMLGDISSLSGVDFGQTLYLGVTIGGDAEMAPRKVLGAVPAAFVAETANDANTVGGVASSSFVRNDEAGDITASTAGTLFSLIQNGAGKIASFFSGVTEVFTILNNGNVGIGTTTPNSKLSVSGDINLTGALRTNGSAGSNGQLLQSNATGVQWISTSTYHRSPPGRSRRPGWPLLPKGAPRR